MKYLTLFIFFWHFAEWTKNQYQKQKKSMYGNATEMGFFCCSDALRCLCGGKPGHGRHFTSCLVKFFLSSYRPRIVRGFSRPCLFNGVDLLCHSLMYCDWPLIWMICMRPPCRRSTFLHLHHFFPNPLLWSNPLHRIWLNNCLHLNVAGTDMRYKLVCWHHDVLVARSRPAFWRPAFASRHSGYSLVNKHGIGKWVICSWLSMVI